MPTSSGNTRTLKVASNFSAALSSNCTMVEADAGEAEASLNALLDDEASKLRILDYLRKWLGDKLEEMPANRV